MLKIAFFFLQMAVRLKRMKLQIKGNVIHIISVTCDFDTVTMIEKSKDILILKKEDAGEKTTRKRFHKKKVIRLRRLTCACSAGGLFSIIDKKPEQFHLLKDEEAIEDQAADDRFWKACRKNASRILEGILKNSLYLKCLPETFQIWKCLI